MVIGGNGFFRPFGIAFIGARLHSVGIGRVCLSGHITAHDLRGIGADQRRRGVGYPTPNFKLSPASRAIPSTLRLGQPRACAASRYFGYLVGKY
jgi:hypothetical protein